MSIHLVELSTEYLHVAASGLLSGLSAVSVSCWIKPVSLAGVSCFLNAWNTSASTATHRQVLVRGSDTDLQCFVYTSAQTGGAVGKTLSTGAWQHVALTYDGSTLIGYLNGLAGGTTYSPSGALATDTNNLGLGIYSTAEHYDGLAEDRAIWNRALSAAEILSMYSARLRAGFFREGLIQWWPLNGVGGDYTNGDFGGRDLAGTLPAVLGTAPTWSTDTPGLHWPPRVRVLPYVAPAVGGHPMMRRWGGVPGMSNYSGRMSW